MHKMHGATWDSIFLTIVKLVTTLTAIIQTKILSIGLSLTDYGTYSQANIIIALGTSLLMLGLGDAINYFYNDASQGSELNKKKSIINTIFAIELVSGIIFVAIIFFARYGIARYFSNEVLAGLAILVAVQPMLDNMIYFYQVLFVSTGRAKLIAVRNLILSLSKLVIIVIAVNVFRRIDVIFISLIVLNILQLVVFAALFRKDGFDINPFEFERKYVNSILKYGIPMGIFTITTTLTREIDKLVVGHMANTETIAIYANCSRLLPFDIIVASFATVLIPYIMKYVSSGNNKSSVQLFENYLKIGYYSVWTFGSGVLIVVNQAISFLYSPEYLPGKGVFIIYVIDSMVKFASMHLILTASGKANLLMKYSILSLLANVGLNIALYKTMGMIGPALATLLVTTVYTIVILNKSKHIIRAKWKNILNIKEVTEFSIGLLVCSGVFSLLNNGLLELGINQYIAMILVLLGFGITILILYRKRIQTVLKTINTLKV